MTSSSASLSLRGRGLRKRYAALLRPLERLFPGWLHPVRRIESRGLDLHLDARTEATNDVSLTDGEYEVEETTFMERAVKDGDVFVDLGANIGYFTCLASRWVGAQGRVLAIEPDRINFRHLRRNIRVNGGDSNTTAVRAAASVKAGTTVLHRSLVNCGDHRIYSDDASSRIGERVRTVAIDDLVGSGRRVDFVKMDVQGAETLVVSGMQRTLEQNAPHIALLIEWWPYGLAQCGSSAAELMQLLEKHGLDLWSLDGEQIADACDPARAEQPEYYLNVVATRAWRW
ncbi:MAG: FkbM family methyltransferase [Planctomycetota bacterium]